MSARCEFTGQRHCRSLNPAVELVAEEQKRGAGTEREMHHLSFERTPAIAVDVNLATAGIVDPAGQIKHRQFGRMRAAGSGPAKEGQASRIGRLTFNRFSSGPSGRIAATIDAGIQSPSLLGTVTVPSGNNPNPSLLRRPVAITSALCPSAAIRITPCFPDAV